MSKIARRQFLETAAAAGVVVGLPATQAQARSANEQVVVGVMGMQRGLALAKSFAGRANVKVKYVCDVDADRAAKAQAEVAKTGQKPQAIGDFRKVLDDADIDALVCAAPNHWHAPATILAVNAGKHVYVEKPCSHNPHEGEVMVAAARKARRAVQMGSQRRSGAGTIQAMKRLHDGVIGRVYLAKSWYTNARLSIGKGKAASVPNRLDYQLWQGPAPRLPYIDNRIHYNWHWFWHWGNGELGNNGVHTLDLCRWGLDVDFPTRVISSGGRYHHKDDQETPDTHTVAFEFDGRRQITWEGHSCNRHRAGFVTFFGDNGSMELDSNGDHRVYDRGDKLVKEYKSASKGDIEHIDNFVSAIRDDRPLALNAEIAEGHKSTLLCHLGNIAQRTGRTLNCDSRNGHILDDREAQAHWKRDYESGWEV